MADNSYILSIRYTQYVSSFLPLYAFFYELFAKKPLNFTGSQKFPTTINHIFKKRGERYKFEKENENFYFVFHFHYKIKLWYINSAAVLSVHLMRVIEFTDTFTRALDSVSRKWVWNSVTQIPWSTLSLLVKLGFRFSYNPATIS